jgi:hypothetical protein
MRATHSLKPATAVLEFVGVAIPTVFATLVGKLTFKLFPLIEYRQRVDSKFTLSTLLELLFDRRIYRSLYVGLAYSSFVGAQCDNGFVCHNAALWVPIVVGVGISYGFLRLSGVRPIAASAGLTVFATGLPLAEASLWQATMFDRLAVLCVAASLTIGIVGVRVALRSHLRSLFLSLIMLLATIACLGTKESGWVGPVGMVALVLFNVRTIEANESENSSALRRRALVAFPSVAWGAWYAVTYYLGLRQDTFGREHVSGGDISSNARWLGRSVLNLDQPLGWLVLIICLCASLFVGWRVRRVTPAAVCSAIALVSMVTPLRTVYQSRFYLQVPSLLLCAAAALAITEVRHVIPKLRPILVPLLVSASALSCVIALRVDENRTQRELLLNGNRVMRTELGPALAKWSETSPVCVEESIYFGYQFLDPPADRKILRFFLSPAKRNNASNWEKRIMVTGPTHVDKSCQGFDGVIVKVDFAAAPGQSAMNITPPTSR